MRLVGPRLVDPSARGGLLHAFRRSYALLAAGSILTGLGAGILLNDAIGGRGMAIVSGLGLGFVAIFAIDALRGLHEAHWWPLIPGTVLILTGLEIDTGTARAQTWLGDWWPLALLAIGVVLIVRVAGRPKASA